MQGHRQVTSAAGPGERSLTCRELQVLHLVAEAKLNKEIADELHLEEGTVKVYVSRLMDKTRARNRTDLAVRYVRGEFTTPK